MFKNYLVPVVTVWVILLLKLDAVICEVNSGDHTNATEDYDYDMGVQTRKMFYSADDMPLKINKWLTFNKWECNTPSGPRNLFWSKPVRAALYNTKMKTRGDVTALGVLREQTRMLTLHRMLRWTSTNSDDSTNRDDTWIYSFSQNAWRKAIQTGPRLFKLEGFLVTMCGDTVVWIGDGEEDRTWIFDGKTETWQTVDIAPVNTSLTAISSSTSVVLSVSALMVGNHESTCHCKESILSFDRRGKVRTTRAMWRDGCFDAPDGYFKRSDFHIRRDPRSDRGYPTDIAVNTAVAATSKGFVLVIAPSTGLWQFDGKQNRWRFFGNASFIRGRMKDYMAAYFQHKRVYVLFTDIGDDLFVYSMKTGKWSTAEMFICSSIFKLFLDLHVVLVDHSVDRVYVYDGTTDPCSQDLHELEAVRGRWTFQYIDCPPTTPPSDDIDLVLVNRNTLYTFLEGYDYNDEVGSTSDGSVVLDLWELNLMTVHAVDLAVQTGNETRRSRLVWGYVMSKHEIVQYKDNITSAIVPMWREAYSLVVLNSTSLFLSGGVGEGLKILSDSWILSLHSPESETVEWSNVTLAVSSTTDVGRYPLPRYKHSTVLINNIIILFGGLSQRSGSCEHDVWHLSLDRRAWTLAVSADDTTGPSSPTECVRNAIGSGQQVIVLTNRVNLNNIDIYKIWIYVPVRRLWIAASEVSGLWQYLSPPLMVWKDYLLLLDLYAPQIIYSYFGCPPGFASLNLTDSPCLPCNTGHYATGTGDTACIKCPNGLTTSSTSAISVSNCSQCIENFCRYGKCLVLQGYESPLPVCQCTVGFTGGNCQYPTYYLIALGLLVFTIVSAAGVLVPLKIWKKKRRRERLLKNHVEQLNSVWQVKENEIQLLDRIGRGGYGDVYRAEYRDMTVAVKVMHLPTDERLVREFEREIVYMQTIRHPNIVMFIGAGKMNTADSPFIVLEFLHRGSVRSVLDNGELSQERRLQFARDIANGMEFLHSLNPPRIHRDLKSDNVLVSSNWTVKICMGKLLGVDDEVKRGLSVRRSSDPLTLSLLEPESDLSTHGLGAARWRAPELSARHPVPVNVTVDVYSFGIVLWEMWTRLTPFPEYSFNYEVMKAVRSGKRPPVPDSCPCEYVTLMTDCWHHDPPARPTFSLIAERLRTMTSTTEAAVST